MSSCVVPSSPLSPREHHQEYNQEHSYAGPLNDDFFDQNFSFMNTDHSMDYFIQTPEPSSQVEDMQGSHDILAEGQGQGDVHMDHAQGDMSHLTLNSSPDNQHHSHHYQHEAQPHEIQLPFQSYSPYALQYETPAHPVHYHPYPYRSYGGIHSPRFSQSPPGPLSPPLSLSPPGSSGSHAHPLSTSPPTAISPSIVSPASAIDSALSDVSPPGVGWGYPLPHQHSHHFAATPLTSVSTLPQLSPSDGGMGMTMVSSYPFPVNHSRLPREKSMRPRAARQSTARSTIVKKEKMEDGDDHSEDGEGLGNGLGLTQSVNDEPDPSSIIQPRDVRKARIESEQRRRDELREGFKRLREALPESNQRASKSSRLDRSVQHIQELQVSLNWHRRELAAAQEEIRQLRMANHKLVNAVAMNSGGGSGSSPGSNGRA